MMMIRRRAENYNNTNSGGVTIEAGVLRLWFQRVMVYCLVERENLQ